MLIVNFTNWKITKREAKIICNFIPLGIVSTNTFSYECLLKMYRYTIFLKIKSHCTYFITFYNLAKFFEDFPMPVNI